MGLRRYPDPVLRKRCSAYGEAEMERAVADAESMLDIMYQRSGVGLAGPQAGICRRVFVIDVSEDRDQPVVLINPRVVDTDGAAVESEEGCLSFPGLYVPLSRPAFARVEYIDPECEPRTIEGENLFARAVQHEADHLDGILFIDRLDPGTRMRIRRELKELEQAFKSG